MTEPSEAVSGWIGPLIGLGFGIATINMLKGLNTTPEQKTEIQRLLYASQTVGNNDTFIVWAYNQNVQKAARVLNSSGFKVITKTRYGDRTQIIYRSKT